MNDGSKPEVHVECVWCQGTLKITSDSMVELTQAAQRHYVRMAEKAKEAVEKGIEKKVKDEKMLEPDENEIYHYLKHFNDSKERTQLNQFINGKETHENTKLDATMSKAFRWSISGVSPLTKIREDQDLSLVLNTVLAPVMKK